MSTEMTSVLQHEDTVRTLHVDDDPAFTDLTAQFLENADDRFEVATATSARDGLDYLADNEVDCVVSDFEMPGMNGIEFLEVVREEYPDLPFVLFTGKGSEAVASDAISAGVTDYLQKETGTDQYAILANRLLNVVAKHRAEYELRESEGRFREIAELSPDGIFRIDRSGVFTYVSPGAEDILDYSADDLLGRDFDHLLAAESEALATEHFTSVLDGEVVQGLELSLRAGDDDRIDVEVSASPVYRDGEAVAVQGFAREITERKRRERELQEGRERYRRLVEHFPNGGVFLFDEDLEYTAVGGGDLEAVGLTPEGMVGRTAREIFPPENAAKLEAAQRAALDGETVVFEDSWQERTYRNYFIPIPDGDGVVRSGMAVAHNITERKAQERKLDALRERSRELMHTKTRAETACVAVETAEEVIGASLSGVHLLNEAGDRLEPTVMADGVAEVFDGDPQYDAGGEPGSRAAIVWDVFERGEALHICETATYEPLTEHSPAGDVLIHPLGDHGVFTVSSAEPNRYDETDEALVEILARSLATALDRVTREAQLRERERHLERLHEATRELVRAEDRSEIAERVVAAAEDILGFSIVLVRYFDEEVGGLVPAAQGDAVERILGAREPFTPDGGSINWRAYDRSETLVYDDIGTVEGAVDSDTPIRSLMVLPVDDHGTLSLAETSPDAFDDSDVFLAGILATAAETALDAQGRQAELREQRNELERQNERLAEFASIVSHDLRNPLNVATGYLDLARQEFESDDLDEVAATLDRMDRFVGDLLTLARSGETVGDLEPTAVGDVARACFTVVDGTKATLSVTLPDDYTVAADEPRLRQVFENLFRNALEHGDAPVTVTVGVLDDDPGFFVADDGPGIPPNERAAVFDLGYSDGGDGEGTGLGLAIVRDVVEGHGWDVTLTESADGGARFEFRGVTVLA